MSEWCEDEDRLDPDERRWPMAPTDLLPRERWRWFEQLWSDVLALGDRYRIRLAKHWWEDGVQVEALAALSAWVDGYDSGEWDDPPGKAVAALRRRTCAGADPRQRAVHPGRDRVAFSRFLIDAGCQPPPGTVGPAKRRADQR